MVADYFTKPLQGGLFYKLRDYIMNIDSSSEHHSSHRSVLDEDDVKRDSGSITDSITDGDMTVDGKTNRLATSERTIGSRPVNRRIKAK